MYIVHELQLFLIYMQSTSDAPLSPKSENGQLLYHCVWTSDIAYTPQVVTLGIQPTLGCGCPTSPGHSWRLWILNPMHPVWQDHWHTCYLLPKKWPPKMPHPPGLQELNCLMTSVSMPLEVHTYRWLDHTNPHYY